MRTISREDKIAYNSEVDAIKAHQKVFASDSMRIRLQYLLAKLRKEVAKEVGIK